MSMTTRTGDKRLLGLCRFSVPLLLKPLLILLQSSASRRHYVPPVLEQCTIVRLLNRRTRSERRAIMILRCLAGTGKDRTFARREIIKAGGTPTAIIALARLVGAALAVNLNIQPPGTRHVSLDELELLRYLAQQQRYRRRPIGNIKRDLCDSLIDAAGAFKGIGVRFPSMLGAAIQYGKRRR